MLLFPCNLDAHSEEIVFIINFFELLPIDDLEWWELLFNNVYDGFGIAKERSEYEYFAVGKPSSFLFLRTFLKMFYWVAYDDLSKVLDQLFLVVFDKYMIKVALDQHLSIVQRNIFTL